MLARTRSGPTQFSVLHARESKIYASGRAAAVWSTAPTAAYNLNANQHKYAVRVCGMPMNQNVSECILGLNVYLCMCIRTRNRCGCMLGFVCGRSSCVCVCFLCVIDQERWLFVSVLNSLATAPCLQYGFEHCSKSPDRHTASWTNRRHS